MPSSESLLCAEHLHLITGARLELSVHGGTICCISGASGSGKTRLLRALADLDDCRGRLWLDGVARDEFSAARWRAAVMLNPAQPRWWLDTVQAHCARDMRGVAEALRLEAERMQAPIDELSTGEQARGGLLRAMSHDPQVLLLDEPTGALDGDSAQATEAVLQDWLSPSRAIVWISHDPAQIRRVADCHYTLDQSGLSPA